MAVDRTRHPRMDCDTIIRSNNGPKYGIYVFFFFLLCQRLKPTHIMRNDTNLRITVDLDRVQVVRQWRNYDLRITEITTNRINFVVSVMLVPNYMYVIITYMSFLMINGMRDSTNLGRQKGNTNLF